MEHKRPRTSERDYVACEVRLRVLTPMIPEQFLEVLKNAVDDLGYGVVLSASVETKDGS